MLDEMESRKFHYLLLLFIIYYYYYYYYLYFLFLQCSLLVGEWERIYHSKMKQFHGVKSFAQSCGGRRE